MKIKLFYLCLIIHIFILIACDKQDNPDILPFDKIMDTENNDNYKTPNKINIDKPILGFFDNKNEIGDKDYYEISFNNPDKSYKIIQTAVPGIDTKITFYTAKHRYLFRIDEKGIGEAEKLWNFTPKAKKILMVIEAKRGYNLKVPYIINFISKQTDDKQEIEPNNSEKEAGEISINKIKKGYIAPKNDVDYYKIITNDDQNYDFSIELETLSNIDINFMIINKKDKSSKFINYSSWGGSENYLYLASNKGEYYIRVSGSTNSSIQKDPLYYISIKQMNIDKENPINYEREFNDSSDSATDLIIGEETEGLLLPKDTDWFKFDLIKNAISIDLSLSKTTGTTPVMELYNSKLELIKANKNSSNLSIRDIKKGRYYIKLSNRNQQTLYRLFLNIRKK